jgi:hypothetical protein
VISDADFTLWADWLRHSRIVSGTFTPSKYYTNSLNVLANGTRS